MRGDAGGRSHGYVEDGGLHDRKSLHVRVPASRRFLRARHPAHHVAERRLRLRMDGRWARVP